MTDEQPPQETPAAPNDAFRLRITQVDQAGWEYIRPTMDLILSEESMRQVLEVVGAKLADHNAKRVAELREQGS